MLEQQVRPYESESPLLCRCTFGLLTTALPVDEAQYDVESAKRDIERFYESALPQTEKRLMQAHDELSALTRREARRYACLHPHSGLGGALKIMNLTVKRYLGSCNGEQLGIPLIEDEDMDRYGGRLLPVFVYHQMDIILNNFIVDQHRKAVLRRLKSVVYGSNAVAAWYEVFLTTFLILEVIEYAYLHQVHRCAYSREAVSP